MTLLAGIVSRVPSRTIPITTKQTLRATVSRSTECNAFGVETSGAYFVKADIGVFLGDGIEVAPSGVCSFVVGEPLLAGPQRAGPTGRSRNEDLRLIANELINGQVAAVRSARGVFAGAVYDPRAAALVIFTDRLGVRPMYWAITPEHFYFATALRILRDCCLVPLTVNLRGATESVALGFALGDRTEFTGISRLGAGEIVRATGYDLQRSTYWNWDEVDPSRDSETALLSEAHDRFVESVRIRQSGRATANAFLSGGLDSRCVVTTLRQQGVEVFSFNFSLPGSLDHVLGREFSSAIGTIHYEGPGRIDSGFNVEDEVREALCSGDSRRCDPGRGILAWSGDGGSVGTGYVYVTPRVIQLARRGDWPGAVTAYLDEQGFSVLHRLLRAKESAESRGILHEGIMAELLASRTEDPARRFYLFLMVNDQRRHLTRHFEDIDLHRVEFELPFLDSEYLAAMSRVPVDMALGHRFYVHWLSRFAAPVSSVPWQAYGEHEPCPLPLPRNALVQWDEALIQSRINGRRRRSVMAAAKSLTSSDFPNWMRKRYLAAATLAHATGLRNYEYVLTAAEAYYQYSREAAHTQVRDRGARAGDTR